MAHCLPELQTIVTWHKTLRFMETFVLNLKKFKKSLERKDELVKANVDSANATNNTQRSLSTDLSITLGTVESLFKSSANFSLNQVLDLIKALKVLFEEDIQAFLKQGLKRKSILASL